MTTQCQYVNPTTCNLAYGKQIIYPQPILSDIVFDEDGSIVVGLMDRAGQQIGNSNYATSNPWASATLYRNLEYPTFDTFTASVLSRPTTPLKVWRPGIFCESATSVVCTRSRTMLPVEVLLPQVRITLKARVVVSIIIRIITVLPTRKLWWAAWCYSPVLVR